MSPPRSSVWKYFDRAEAGWAKCKVCFKKCATSKNTSNLWTHLKKHKEINIGPASSRNRPTEESNSNDPSSTFEVHKINYINFLQNLRYSTQSGSCFVFDRS